MRSSTSVLRRAAVAVAVLAGAGLVTTSLPFSPVRTVIVSGTSMEPGMHAGDLVLAVRRPEYRRGDVVAFRVPRGDASAGKLVIHRIVGGGERDGYRVRGDNREGRDPWRPTSADVVGTAVLRVPRLGLVPAHMRTSAGLALLAALVTIATLLGTAGRPPAEARSDADGGDIVDPPATDGAVTTAGLVLLSLAVMALYAVRGRRPAR